MEAQPIESLVAVVPSSADYVSKSMLTVHAARSESQLAVDGDPEVVVPSKVEDLTRQAGEAHVDLRREQEVLILPLPRRPEALAHGERKESIAG